MPTFTRRDAVRAGGAGLLAAIAGCSAPSSDTTPVDTTSASPSNATVTAWTDDLGSEPDLGPALADGTLYVGTADGTLHALDPADGSTRWTADVGPGFFGGTGGLGTAPTADGHVYVVSGAQSGPHGTNYRVTALDGTTGEKGWTHSVDSPNFLTLLGVRDGTVYAATSDDYLQNAGETLYALDATTGDVQWTGEVGDPMEWAIGAGGAYVAAFSGLRAVSLADGSPLWEDSGRLSDGVHVVGDTVVAGFDSEDRPSLAGLDPQSGDVRWTGPNCRVPSYAAADGVVYAGGETAAAYDATDGAKRWTAESGWGGFVTGPPVDGRLFVRRDGFLHVFDAATGTRDWGTEVEVDGALVAGASRVAYVAASEDAAVPSTLVVRDAASGDVVRSVTFDAADGLTTPVVDGASVFVATSGGRVVGIRS